VSAQSHDDHRRYDSSPGEQAAAPLPELASRLGYLLKHAQLRLAELTASALAPFGVSGRQLAVLIAIDSRVPLSQQEVAGRLGVDRTTMVALIDELEDNALVQRRRDPDDRRKNVVALTDVGTAALRQATQASDGAERLFLGTLSDDQTAQLKAALRAITFPAAKPPSASAGRAG
jgi:DNA-binding MarR family transcriptional regulator